MLELVVIESPLAGDFERNLRYARWCILDCLMRGEAPFASHLLYPQCLDDRDEAHRRLGIEAGFAWGELARHVYYIDTCGPLLRARHDFSCWSRGMREAWHKFGGTVRSLPNELLDAFERGESPRATPVAVEVFGA